MFYSSIQSWADPVYDTFRDIRITQFDFNLNFQDGFQLGALDSNLFAKGLDVDAYGNIFLGFTREIPTNNGTAWSPIDYTIGFSRMDIKTQSIRWAR